MATQHGTNSEYSNSPGGLDITWFKDNYFYMLVTLPYDITPYTYEAAITDKLGNPLFDIDIAIAASGSVTGTLGCSLSGVSLNTLPAVSYWYLDQIDSLDRKATLLGGLFTVKQKGEA